MSNGYLLAAEADIEAARGIADGFGLDVIGAGAIADHETTGAALAAAANVGLVLSAAAAADEAFVALVQSLAQRLERAQLILLEPDARAAFPFIPEAWPAMSIEEAQLRASDLARQRDEAATAPEGEPAPPTEQRSAPEAAEPPAEPPPAPTADAEPPPAPSAEAEAPPPLLGGVEDDARQQPAAPPAEEEAPPTLDSRYGDMGEAMRSDPSPEAQAPSPAPEEAPPAASAPEPPPVAAAPPPAPASQAPGASSGANDDELEIPSFLRRQREAAEPQMPPAPEPPTLTQAAPEPPQAPPTAAPQAPPAAASRPSQTRAGAVSSAPADATAFAPRKLRRETPELVRIVIHQPQDLQAVIKAARKIDRRAEPAPQSMSIGDVALGASIGVALDVRGGRCDGTLQRRTWIGQPIDFSFTVEADAGVKQAVFLARVFINDAQIGVLAFTRQIKGPAKRPTGMGDRARLKRHKRVFLSYSSHDRETVAAIATAYQMAGVQHFWDRASLKSGEEWSPRLRREIDRSDLFHLCWSRAAASSQWVEREAEHALTRRRRSNGKRPEITVQMLDGPPWAPHPPALDSINFDDFVRAAIVGYARGDGGR